MNATVRPGLLRLSLSSLLVGLPLSVPAATSVPSTGQPVARARYLMGTVCQAIAYGDDAAAALDASFDEIARLESVLSDYRPDSELSRLNRSAASAPFPCSPDLYDLIAASTRLCTATGGAFDITVAPLVKAWDLRGNGRLPTEEALAHARSRVGCALLRLDPGRRTVSFAIGGMAIDPGGIGKGFALDAAARLLLRRGVHAALLDFGGQILAIGAPPGSDSWQVDIAHPLRRDEQALTLSLRDASASTSGGSERHVIVGGRELAHIVDPRSGRPLETRGTATVVAPTGTEADAVSTAMLVLGPVEGRRWLAAMPGLFAIWLDVDEAGRLLVVQGGQTPGNVPVRIVRSGVDNHGGVR